MNQFESKASYGDDNPIAAFATTPGNSALTLIRCSGKNCIELISPLFAAARTKETPGNTVLYGWIVSDNEKIDEVLVSVFRAPKSYTGEDSLDITCHGGPSAGKAVMAALLKSGFREALPGEFSFRAFTNGKLDLTKAESVMELVSAKTETGRRHAVSRLSGTLLTEISEIKKLLVTVLAAAELYLDYSEDEICSDENEKEGKLPNMEDALCAMERLMKLSNTWKFERVYQEGITAVIAGRPNAGKSSLFNAFLKEDRSIVTETPGTTRDWIEAWVSAEGIPVRLIDTAGLRETDDSVEKIGVERSRRLINEADIVLYLLDGEQGLTAEDENFIDNCDGLNVAAIWNKCDIAMPPKDKIDSYLPVSVKTGYGMDDFFPAFSFYVRGVATEDWLNARGNAAGAALGTERQKKLVDAAVSALGEALAMTERGEPLDLIAPLISEAVNALGEITGEVSTADILEEMFSRFCVGK